MEEKDKIIQSYKTSQELYWKDKKLTPANFLSLMSVHNLLVQNTKELLKQQGLSPQEIKKAIGQATKKVGDDRRENGESGIIASTQSI